MLQSVMREHRYASWRTALSSVIGIYLITDTLDGRQYVGKADGMENIRQRWGSYAANGHGGNVELKGLQPAGFRFSLLRVFDPATEARDRRGRESLQGCLGYTHARPESKLIVDGTTQVPTCALNQATRAAA